MLKRKRGMPWSSLWEGWRWRRRRTRPRLEDGEESGELGDGQTTKEDNSSPLREEAEGMTGSKLETGPSLQASSSESKMTRPDSDVDPEADTSASPLPSHSARVDRIRKRWQTRAAAATGGSEQDDLDLDLQVDGVADADGAGLLPLPSFGRPTSVFPFSSTTTTRTKSDTARKRWESREEPRQSLVNGEVKKLGHPTYSVRSDDDDDDAPRKTLAPHASQSNDLARLVREKQRRFEASLVAAKLAQKYTEQAFDSPSRATPAFDRLLGRDGDIEDEIERMRLAADLPKFLTALTEDQVGKVDRVVRQVDKVMSNPDLTIAPTPHDIASVSGGNWSSWLNDEVINMYAEMIKLRSSSAKWTGLKVWMFNSFFFQKLSQGGWSAVRRWTRKENLVQEYQLILIPVHLPAHWVLISIDLVRKNLAYHDSLGGDDRGALEMVWRWLVEEATAHAVPLESRPVREAWTLINRADSPRQRNAVDCGVFTLGLARELSEGGGANGKFYFGHKYAQMMRKRLILEMAYARLL